MGIFQENIWRRKVFQALFLPIASIKEKGIVHHGTIISNMSLWETNIRSDFGVKVSEFSKVFHFHLKNSCDLRYNMWNIKKESYSFSDYEASETSTEDQCFLIMQNSTFCDLICIKNFVR